MTEKGEQASKQKHLKREISWYLTLLLIILVACMPGGLCSLYYLSTVPDIVWQRGSRGLTADRIWMVRLRYDPVGVGYESRRLTRTISDNEVCVTSTVRYFLWSDAGEEVAGARFSHLFRQSERGWQSTGEVCN